MINNIHNIDKTKKINLIKSGCFTLAAIPLVVLSGCNSKKLDDYYLVVKDGNYYICYRTEPFSNYDDYDYNSITTNKTVGSICSNGNSFDYECHHFSVHFISDFQVANLKEVLSQDSMDYSKLIATSNSLELKQIGDNYYQNKKYYLETQDNNKQCKLALFESGDKIIIGYDISPERLENTNRYIYSITDSDTLVFHSNSDITTHDIDLDNADSAFITYDTALSIVENYDNQKVLKK